MDNTSSMFDSLKNKQVQMHRDFFMRAKSAVNNGFYLEAIFLEYAAIESRLEVILGLLGYPCNKSVDRSIRRRVNISDRVECLRVCRNKNKLLFDCSKLDEHFFARKGVLRTWIWNRNVFIHGLYKDASEYTSRKKDCKDIAENGLLYARLLYNEAKRLNRIAKNHPEQLDGIIRLCKSKECVAVKSSEDKKEV